MQLRMLHTYAESWMMVHGCICSFFTQTDVLWEIIKKPKQNVFLKNILPTVSFSGLTDNSFALILGYKINDVSFPENIELRNETEQRIQDSINTLVSLPRQHAAQQHSNKNALIGDKIIVYSDTGSPDGWFPVFVSCKFCHYFWSLFLTGYRRWLGSVDTSSDILY